MFIVSSSFISPCISSSAVSRVFRSSHLCFISCRWWIDLIQPVCASAFGRAFKGFSIAGKKMNLRALILHQRAPKVSRNYTRCTTVKSTEDEVIRRLKRGGKCNINGYEHACRTLINKGSLETGHRHHSGQNEDAKFP